MDSGATHNRYVDELVEFGSRFVDSKYRKLRLNAFGLINKMPVACPRNGRIANLQLTDIVRRRKQVGLRSTSGTLKRCSSCFSTSMSTSKPQSRHRLERSGRLPFYPTSMWLSLKPFT